MKETPDETLLRLGQPSENRYGSWHTELVDALREAIQQRNQARSNARTLRSALKVIAESVENARIQDFAAHVIRNADEDYKP